MIVMYFNQLGSYPSYAWWVWKYVFVYVVCRYIPVTSIHFFLRISGKNNFVTQCDSLNAGNLVMKYVQNPCMLTLFIKDLLEQNVQGCKLQISHGHVNCERCFLNFHSTIYLNYLLLKYIFYILTYINFVVDGNYKNIIYFNNSQAISLYIFLKINFSICSRVTKVQIRSLSSTKYIVYNLILSINMYLTIKHRKANFSDILIQ